MKILTFPVGQMQANCYFIVNDGDCLIFDAGDSAEFLLEEILRLKLQPLAIFATHGHFDHIMAVGEIQLSYDVPFYIANDDHFLVHRLKETADHFLQQKNPIIPPKHFHDLQNGELKGGSISMRVMRTPGHTPCATCFYFKDGGWLLTGDTLFKDAIGRYDFSYSDKTLLKNSLNHLFKLPEETIVYPGHGQETTIGEEKNRPL